jgi:hypothetical protein
MRFYSGQHGLCSGGLRENFDGARVVENGPGPERGNVSSHYSEIGRSNDASIRCIASPLVFAVWTEFLSHDPGMGGPLKFNGTRDGGVTRRTGNIYLCRGGARE